MMDGKNYKKRRANVDYTGSKRTKSTNEIVRKVMRKVIKREEVKNTYVNSASASCDTTGLAVSLFQASQGTGVSGRVGAKVTFKGMHVKLHVKAANADAWGHWVLLYDKESNAALPAMTDIWVAQDGMSERTHLYKQRFTTLKKGEFAIVATGDTKGTPYQDFEFYVPLKNKECRFNSANGGTIADIQSGSLILAFNSNVAAGATAPSMYYASSVQWTDS